MKKKFNPLSFFTSLIIYLFGILLFDSVGLFIGNSSKFIAVIGAGILFWISFENKQDDKVGKQRTMKIKAYDFDALLIECDKCKSHQELGITNTNWTLCRNCANAVGVIRKWKSSFSNEVKK